MIAATHAPVEDRVRAGTFREDLYFRLRVVELVVPPLRERREDIPLLVEHLARRVQRDMHREAVIVTPAAMRVLQAYDWPGNVRELENAIARAVALSPSGVLTPNDFVLDGRTVTGTPAAGSEVDSLANAVRRHIERALQHTGGNKRAAARILRISRPRLDRLIAEGTDSKRGHDGNEA